MGTLARDYFATALALTRAEAALSKRLDQVTRLSAAGACLVAELHIARDHGGNMARCAECKDARELLSGALIGLDVAVDPCRNSTEHGDTEEAVEGIPPLSAASEPDDKPEN